MKCHIPKERLNQSSLSIEKHGTRGPGESGFTLIEVAIAMLIMMIAGIGISSLIAYAIKYNSGAQDRAATIAVAQQQLELLRTKTFNSTTTDPALAAVTNNKSSALPQAGRKYTISTTITDISSSNGTLKQIDVTVSPDGAGILGSSRTVTLSTLRARAN
jgi:Tfp pilus assembly protein PilV